MAAIPAYATSPVIGGATVSLGDVSRTLPITFVTPLTAGASGTRIDQVDLIGAGTTTATTTRLWIYNGATYRLWKEVPVQAITPSTATPIWMYSISSQLNSDVLPLVLPTGYSLRASINDTQVIQAAQVNSIAASGTLSGTVTLGNSVFTATAASAAAVSALQTTAGAAFLTQTSSPYAMATPSVLTLTSTGNISAVNFTINGIDTNGVATTEVLAGPNNSTVYSTKTYNSILNIYASAAVGTNTSAGYSSSVLFPTAPTKITITSQINASGTNFTIRGIDQSGAQSTEVLAGPTAAATVTSVNTYRAVTLVSASASTATTSVGTPVILSGVNVIPRGGDF